MSRRGRKPTGGAGTSLSDYTLAMIVCRLKQGEGAREIAQAVHVSHETVYAIGRRLGLPKPLEARRAARGRKALAAFAASPQGRFLAQHGPRLDLEAAWDGRRVVVRRIEDWAPVAFYWPRHRWTYNRGANSYYRANVRPAHLGIVVAPDGRFLVVEPREQRRCVYLPAPRLRALPWGPTVHEPRWQDVYPRSARRAA